jgi:predicted MFS family arabinose efflux permease
MEPKALPSACMLVFLSGGMVGVSHFLFYYSTEIGYPTPERFFFVSASFMLLSNLFTARYSDRVQPLALMAPSLAGGVLCNVLLAAAIGNPAVLMPLAGVFHGFSLGIGFPMLNQIAVKASPASRRGAASATFYLAMDIGVGGFAVLWGWALDNWSFRTAYGGAAITIAISLALCFFFLGRKKHPLIQK